MDTKVNVDMFMATAAATWYINECATLFASSTAFLVGFWQFGLAVEFGPELQCFRAWGLTPYTLQGRRGKRRKLQRSKIQWLGCPMIPGPDILEKHGVSFLGETMKHGCLRNIFGNFADQVSGFWFFMCGTGLEWLIFAATRYAWMTFVGCFWCWLLNIMGNLSCWLEKSTRSPANGSDVKCLRWRRVRWKTLSWNWAATSSSPIYC